MPEYHSDSLSSGNAAGDATLTDPRPVAGLLPRDAAPEGVLDAARLAQIDREQLARDIAEIERAAAALRQGEPALESWTTPPAPTTQNPRPLWLLIGVLWLSTALVTAGAVVAIAAFVG